MTMDGGMRYLRWWRSVGAIFLVTVVVGSLLPLSPMAQVFNDKLEHFLVYFLLMAWFGQLYRRRLILVTAFVLMGLVLEILQGQTRYRYFDWYDVAANSTGILVAWATLFTPLGRSMAAIDHWLQRQLESRR